MSNKNHPGWKISGLRPCAGLGDSCRFTVNLERGADGVRDVTLEAGELLDYRAFQTQMLRTSGRLVRFAAVESADDPAGAWLELVETALERDAVRRKAPGFRPSPPPPRYQTLDAGAQEMMEIGGGD